MSGILEAIISEDYELTGQGDWLKSIEHDSLVIDVRKQLFFWNSREIVGDAYVWLTEIKGMSSSDAWKILRSYKQYEGEFIHVIKGKNDEDFIVYPALVDVFWNNGLSQRDYWYKRTIKDETIDRYKLGYYNGWSMIPFYQDGLFKDFQMRRDDPKKIKHWYTNTGILLFNSDVLRVTDTIYLVEGPTSCLVLNQNGMMSVSHNAGAGGWDDKWFPYFMHQKLIYILYDNDSAGRLGAHKVATKLGEYRTKVYTFDGFAEHYDAGDFFKEGGTKDELKRLVEGKSKFAFELQKESNYGKRW